jgi:preprotein translocase subunit SecB
MKEKVTYNDFIKGIELKGIYISNLTASREKEFDTPANIHIGSKKDFEKLEKGSVEMRVEYTLTAIKDGKKKPGFEISVVYTLLFQSKIEITEAYFKKFSHSLTVETWPYFRNLVNELTMKMGLPPLVLRVLKVMPKVKKTVKDAKD